jgi:hypothetical protein
MPMTQSEELTNCAARLNACYRGGWGDPEVRSKVGVYLLGMDSEVAENLTEPLKAAIHDGVHDAGERHAKKATITRPARSMSAIMSGWRSAEKRGSQS